MVDWLLLAAVGLETIGGLYLFTVGKPQGRWLFYAHGLLGLSILMLLFWKLRRVRRRLAPDRLQPATILSIMISVLALLTIAMGLTWTTWQRPTGYPTGMNWHVILGLALLATMIAHALIRRKPLRKSHLPGRRNALGLLTMLGAGALIWHGQQALNEHLQLPGARRRFTGSRPLPATTGNAFPVTMWMFDNPDPIALDTWRLTISGATVEELQLAVEDLSSLANDRLTATLDCTGGWHTTRTWRGVQVGRLLERATVAPEAVAVSFVSTTGYRWSLPIAEAKSALLATHVDDEALSFGHGAPLRLVAPGRRGFQWVKWVTEVTVLTRYDAGQWGVIFTSGLNL